MAPPDAVAPTSRRPASDLTTLRVASRAAPEGTAQKSQVAHQPQALAGILSNHFHQAASGGLQDEPTSTQEQVSHLDDAGPMDL